MKKPIKKAPFKTSDFLGSFQPKVKRSREEPWTRIKRILRKALPFQDKEVLEDLHKKLPT